MTDSIPDIIDHLAGITPGSKGETLRARRPVTRDEAQRSWLALFSPEDDSHAALIERHAVAVFVAALHGATDIADFYAAKLREADNGAALAAAIDAAVAAGATTGPYGHYPAGPLSAEDQDGLLFAIPAEQRAVLGTRLSAALEHAHLLVFHLRDSRPEALGKLIDAGWSTSGIVTLSQLVSFLAFQIRVIAGLKVLAAA